jgi:hypothetical protein
MFVFVVVIFKNEDEKKIAKLLIFLLKVEEKHFLIDKYQRTPQKS